MYFRANFVLHCSFSWGDCYLFPRCRRTNLSPTSTYRTRGAGFGVGVKGGLGERVKVRELAGSGGMLPRKKFTFKASEMSRNESKTVNTDVNVLIVSTKICFLFF